MAILFFEMYHEYSLDWGGGGGEGVIFLADVQTEWDLKISLALFVTYIGGPFTPYAIFRT